MNPPELEAIKQFEMRRERLIEIYRKHNPEALGTVDEQLRQWRGREDELLRAAEAKYEGREVLAKQAEDDYRMVVDTLKNLYKAKIRPAEEAYRFDLFFSPYLEDADFEAKPMILLLGQYSVGKTTFIRHLLQRDFPGMRIGPEPTTDRFTAVMAGAEDAVIPGNALTADVNSPFRALEKFGSNFLNRVEAVKCSSKILESLTFIDTPGVLSGEKQRIGRNYDFPRVVEWFAERADRILLLFDAHKLDISDEFKRVIEACRGHDEKIRVVLNKADSVSPQQLLRVYGALMWSLGKVLKTPEVARVYVGSFTDTPIDPSHENYALFQAERADLMADLMSLPRNSSVRKVNETLKRARLIKLHMTIMHALRLEMPTFFGKERKQQQLLKDLPNQFRRIGTQFRVPESDFPDSERMRSVLETLDLSKFPSSNEKFMKKVESALAEDVPTLMKGMRHPELDKYRASGGEGGDANPFSTASLGGSDGTVWAVSQTKKSEFDAVFRGSPLNAYGKLAGAAARDVLLATSGLGPDALFLVWGLSDIDRDGALDADEFAVAMHLCERSRMEANPEGWLNAMGTLPPELVPPSKRGMATMMTMR